MKATVLEFCLVSFQIYILFLFSGFQSDITSACLLSRSYIYDWRVLLF